jgi:hypothetical protein
MIEKSVVEAVEIRNFRKIQNNNANAEKNKNIVIFHMR